MKSGQRWHRMSKFKYMIAFEELQEINLDSKIRALF